jgi:hypothetical protein
MVKYFKNGMTSNDEDERSGRHSTSRSEIMIAQVRSSICENRRLTVREAAEEDEISISSYHKILMEDLGMHQVSAKPVPRLFTDDLQNLIQRANNDENLSKNVITSDETWVYGYDVETKQQSSHWKSPASPHPPKELRQVRS